MTLVYVGTYSGQIALYDLDTASGTLSHRHTLTVAPDPSYLALGLGERMLYAVNENVQDGGVSAFAVDRLSGQLSFVNRVASGGADPAHLSVDSSGGWVLVANYTGGTVATLPIGEDGALGEASHVVQHTGSGPNPGRQQSPHPHMIVSDPRGEFVLVPDLGADRVVAYRLDRDTGQLLAQPDVGGHLRPGAGPRHLAFGANGRYAYVLDELDSTMTVFTYDAATGRLNQTQVVRTLPDDISGNDNTTAALVVAPNGRFVYASNRGHDSIAVLAIDGPAGQVALRGHTPTGGRTPRDINLDPSGRIMLAANQDSDSVVSFFVDEHTGLAEPTGQSTAIPRPARVLFSRV